MGDRQSSKGMSSITKKLHWRFWSKKIGIYASLDILLFVLLVGSFFWIDNYVVNGTTDPMVSLEFHYVTKDNMQGEKNFLCYMDDDGEILTEEKVDQMKKYDRYLFKHLTYVVMNDQTEQMVARNLYTPFKWAVIGIGGLFVLQFMGTFFVFYGEDRKIRKILEPINEMAIKADELSKLTLSEERYHEIENAIDTIQPGENGTLSLDNSDLKGIEAAMNNLIIRMRDTYRQQSRFVNDASHELRTPITVIQGYVNMLDRWGKEDQKILAESIDAIKNETDHMQHLVEQLLFLARGDSGKTTLDIEEFQLNEMAKEVYEESLMIDEDHIYRFKDSEYPVIVRADLGLLKQAFRILIDNAAKYTKPGDEIMISVGKTEQLEPFIQVQDTGIGMAEKDVANMFERFYRSDEVRNFQGTGLGLSIAKWIVDKHQGHFEILSRTELGTRIRIIL